MRNLKKVLSLVLCVAMMLSVMVVGAGAAFADQNKITHTEAVDMAVALKIIDGKENNKFDPTGNVTRAEMCKMICVALNGGKAPVLGSADKTSFTDTKGHWAAAYIEACFTQGIVSGVGNNMFEPEASVTPTQAAKMLLVALGFKSENEGFTGPSWAVKVNIVAASKHLYDELVNVATDKAMTRDDAAQMIYNTLNANLVEYKTDLVNIGGQWSTQITVKDKVDAFNNKITFLKDKYEAETFEGIFNGNYKTAATGKDGYIDVAGNDFEFNFDLRYIGEEVKVLFKDENNNGLPDSKDIIYGVYVTGDTDVIETTSNDIKSAADYATPDKIKVDGVEYSVATPSATTDVLVVKNYNDALNVPAGAITAAAAKTAFSALSAQNGDNVKFILNDDGKVAKAYVTTYNIAKVTAVNSTKVSLNGVGSIEFKDNDIYDGIAKNDVVVYQKFYKTAVSDATFVITKAETVSGKLTGYKGTPVVTSVTVNGTAYDTLSSALVGGLTDDAKTTFATSDINKDVTLYMVNGYAAAADMAATSSNYALVESVGTGTVGGVDNFKMKVILADGTEKIVTVDEDGTVSTAGAFGDGDLIKYASISDSNVMDVSSIAQDVSVTTPLTAAAANKIYNKDTKSFATNAAVTSYTISASDAVLFVKVGTKYYSYDMRSLGNITAVFGSTKFFSVNNSDGKVIAAYVELTAKPGASTATTVYGIVTAEKGVVKIGDEYKNHYVVANDKGEYNVYMPTSTSTIAKGDIVSFDKASDDTYAIADVTEYTSTNAFYVKELDKDKVISYYADDGSGNPNTASLISKALDDDAQIVYVDQNNNVAGEDIGVGEYDSIAKHRNAVIVLENDKVVAIIVETSGECDIL